MVATTQAPTRTDSPLYLSPVDIIRRYGLGRTQVYQLIWSGELPSVKVGRSLRVPVAAIDDFLARQPSGAKTAPV